MLDVEIVKMSVDHLDDIMVVERLSFSVAWSRDAFIEEITRNRFARYISAKANNRIIGYAGMWKVFDEGHITNIAVHPEYRGKGIGSSLVEELIKIAKNEGITRMTLEVRESNIAAQRLYSKYGFRKSGIRKAYYADNSENAIIMWKEFT